MIYIPTCHTKMYIVLVFNHCVIPLWLAYIGSDVYKCTTRWKMDKGQKESTCLHNEMDSREGHSLNRCDMCGQRGNNRKTCET
jgi:hypothetical protein